jgi:hypothetical protein
MRRTKAASFFRHSPSSHRDVRRQPRILYLRPYAPPGDASLHAVDTQKRQREAFPHPHSFCRLYWSWKLPSARCLKNSVRRRLPANRDSGATDPGPLPEICESRTRDGGGAPHGRREHLDLRGLESPPVRARRLAPGCCDGGRQHRDRHHGAGWNDRASAARDRPGRHGRQRFPHLCAERSAIRGDFTPPRRDETRRDEERSAMARSIVGGDWDGRRGFHDRKEPYSG